MLLINVEKNTFQQRKNASICLFRFVIYLVVLLLFLHVGREKMRVVVCLSFVYSGFVYTPYTSKYNTSIYVYMYVYCVYSV